MGEEVSKVDLMQEKPSSTKGDTAWLLAVRWGEEAWLVSVRKRQGCAAVT